MTPEQKRWLRWAVNRLDNMHGSLTHSVGCPKFDPESLPPEWPLTCLCGFNGKMKRAKEAAKTLGRAARGEG